MKKISEHLGEVIVSIACIALLISTVSLFKAPVGDFFASINNGMSSVGSMVLAAFQAPPGEGGIPGGGTGGGESGGYTEVPDNVAEFYSYTLTGDGYTLGLTDDFKTALDNNTDYVVDGETLWTAGSALPNPGSTYSGEPVTSMASMFKDCSGVTELDLSGWDTSNVTNMEDVFYGCRSLSSLDLSNFDTTNVTNMSGMFSYCSSLRSFDLSNFDTTNVTNMSGMFALCNSSAFVELDLSSFDTTNVTDMGYMFSNCQSLTSIVARTSADKAKFEASEAFPSGCTVTVK